MFPEAYEGLGVEPEALCTLIYMAIKVDVGTIVIPALQVRELMIREAK